MHHSTSPPLRIEDNNSIESVSDLLFGERIVVTEHRLSGSKVQEELYNQKLESCEEKITSVDKRLKSEADTRISQGEDFWKHIAKTESALNDKISRLEGRLQTIENTSQSQTDELSTFKSEMMQRLELSSVDRTELGEFLIELGQNITGSKSPLR